MVLKVIREGRIYGKNLNRTQVGSKVVLMQSVVLVEDFMHFLFVF